jgi:hypothetical protein
MYLLMSEEPRLSLPRPRWLDVLGGIPRQPAIHDCQSEYLF